MALQALKITKKKDRTQVAISGPMTILQAAELREGLLKAFDAGSDVELSLAGVTEMDLTALQLLCSAHRTSLQKGVRLALVGGQPQAVAAVVELAGMQRLNGCAQDVAGTCVWKKEA